MTSEADARSRIRTVLAVAVDSFDVPLDLEAEAVASVIRCAFAGQGVDPPAALDEYLRAAGSDNGVGRLFPRGQPVTARGCVAARMIAIETALLSGVDWQMFRFAEPVVVFNCLPGGEVFWVEFDPDDPDPDHDPPVWVLSEKSGSQPKQVAETFSSHVAESIALEVRMRSKYGG